MRLLFTARCTSVLSLVVSASGCNADHYGCPGGCETAALATFNLACSPNDLTKVVATGPCATPDAGLSWYTGTATEWTVGVASTSPGECHIELVFATGYTYSADVTFTSQTQDGPPGCPQCPAFIGPTSGPFTVNNPSETCVHAGLDAGIGDAHIPSIVGDY